MLKLIVSCGACGFTIAGLQIIFAVDIPLSATVIVLAGVFVYRFVEECF